MASKDSFGARGTFEVGGTTHEIFRISAVPGAEALPFTHKVLLENLLRTEDGANVTADQIRTLGAWDPDAEPTDEIQFTPARVIMQDFTGVPCVVDLATMREAMKDLGGDPAKINPLAPAELVIDHSVIADFFGTHDSATRNVALEYERNRERYQFLRWGQTAFDEFKVVPPGTGIVHQVNIEALARVVMVRNGQAYPDTCVGTDSHTTMVNGLGVLGWGVGGIEAEAAMLGQPVSMLIPQVVGFKLTGELPQGATATDMVLTITEILRKHGVVGKFVEFFGDAVAGGAAGQPRHDRQHEPRVRLDGRDLPDRRRDPALPAADRAHRGAGRPRRGLLQGAGPLARPLGRGALHQRHRAGPRHDRALPGRPEAPAGPGGPHRGEVRLPVGAGLLHRRSRRHRSPEHRGAGGHHRSRSCRDRRDHLVHQHVEPVGDDGGRACWRATRSSAG